MSATGTLIPIAGAPRPITVPADGGLQVLQAAVGGDIEALPFPGRDDVTAYINEEGKVGDEPELNALATALLAPCLFAGDFIAGPCVIVGFDPETGENRDLPASPEVLAACLELPRPEREQPYARAIEWQWLLAETEVQEHGVGWTERRLAALTCTYETGVGLRAVLHNRERATSPDSRIAREKLRLGAPGTVTLTEPLRRFSQARLERFADVALADLRSRYPSGDPGLTRHFALAHGGSLST